MIRKLYQLHARGTALNGYHDKCVSKKVFSSKEEAEGFMSVWKKNICDPNKFEAFDVEELKISILEIELDEK